MVSTPGLNAEQRGISHAMVSMIENHFAWVVLWWRAKYPESMIRGYQVNLRNALNTRLPNPILNICFKFTAARKVSFVTISPSASHYLNDIKAKVILVYVGGK